MYNLYVAASTFCFFDSLYFKKKIRIPSFRAAGNISQTSGKQPPKHVSVTPAFAETNQRVQLHE